MEHNLFMVPAQVSPGLNRHFGGGKTRLVLTVTMQVHCM